MASVLQATRFAEGLKRIFNLKARSILDAVDSTVLPVVQVLDPEDFAIAKSRGEFYAGAFQGLSCIAGQQCVGQIRNLPGSGKLVIVDAVEARAVTAQDKIVFRIGVGPDLSVSQGFYFDSRLGSPAGPRLTATVPSTGTTGLVGSVLATLFSGSSVEPVGARWRAVLLPGWAAQVHTFTVQANAMDVQWYFHERDVEPSELS